MLLHFTTLYFLFVNIILSYSELQPANDYEDIPKLEPINGSINQRLRSKINENHPWSYPADYCVRPAKCEVLQIKTCLGAKIPYTSTTLELTHYYSQQQTIERLLSYRALQHVPKCWSVIQPFLCAVHFPRCEKVGKKEMVYVPSFEMCNKTLEACKILYNTSFFPEFLKCNESLYSTTCKNDVTEMKFNISRQCLSPLVDTDEHFYPEIDDCGLQCKDPMYTEDEHQQIHTFIGWWAGICFGFNAFAVLTFIIDWKTGNKYPGVAVFYINLCFLMSCFGWLAQFVPGAREDIVCRRDGTLRQSEPNGGNLSCVTTFFVIYYCMIAAMVWFVIFNYTLYMESRARDNIQNKIDKNNAYFHIIAWLLPLVLTIAILAMGKVDGISIVGICFVGYLNLFFQILLLAPLVVTVIIGGYFIIRTLKKLSHLKRSDEEILSPRASQRIGGIIIRLGICTFLILVIVACTLEYYIHQSNNTIEWGKSLREFIICRIISSYSEDPENCRMTSRPSVGKLQFQLLCTFSAGVVMSTWVLTCSSVNRWKRFIRRKFGCEIEEPAKIQKHRVIAQAFAKRNEFDEDGRLSIDFGNIHTDPVGLNFDLNSAASNDFSSTWANNLLHFVNRRCAITGAPQSSSQAPVTSMDSEISVSVMHMSVESRRNSIESRRNSMDSEISVSVMHVSLESRRNSLESQVSVKFAEVKAKVARKIGKGKRNGRRRGEYKNKRRNSSTSIDSHKIAAQILQTKLIPNLNRRKANAGLDSAQIENLLSNSKLLMPMFKNSNLTSSDEEESQSFCNQDIVFNKKTSREYSCKGGVSIEEYQTTDDEENKVYPTFHHVNELGGGDNNTPVKKEKDGRSSGNSNKSRKSSRQSIKRNRRNIRGGRGLRDSNTKYGTKEKKQEANDSLVEKYNKNNEISDLESSFTSYCSELSPLAVQSSFSGVSAGKTHSRNSKTSCDVGIQANAHEIATQTMSSYEFDKYKNIDDILPNKSGEKHIAPPKPKRTFECQTESDSFHSKNKKRNDSYSEENETQQLLLPNKRDPIIVPKKRSESLTRNCLSENEKLKLLLLPSK